MLPEHTNVVNHGLTDIAVLATAASFILYLFSKKVRHSAIWKATVTPLASIIGSGFLVVTPLYILILGKYALLAIIGMVCVAYMAGYVIRYNIDHVEPKMQYKTHWPLLAEMERLSYLALAVAYLISIPFYIKLLSLFLLRGIHMQNEIVSNITATCILASIGLIGIARGFEKLELMEEYSVSIKLAMIFAMMVGLLIYNVDLLLGNQWRLHIVTPLFDTTTLRQLLGTFIIVQGFETSRYLGLNYSPETRVKTMRFAQVLSGVIYVSFVALSMVIFSEKIDVSETVVIDLSERISNVLPALMIIAAIMSQFSASVADIVGSGGLISEASASRLKPNRNYFIIAIISIVITWSADIFSIIALASRAFAFYYAVQAAEAVLIARRNVTDFRSLMSLVIFVLMLLLMSAVTIFGISL